MEIGDNPPRKQCVRYNIPGHVHILTFSCYKRQPLLADERACQYLAEAITKAKSNHCFHIWSYVFMPEHVHLLIWPECETYFIPDILSSIKQSTSRRMIIYLRKNEPDRFVRLATGQKHIPYRFWQDGGGYDRNITESNTLFRVVEYMHNNPVRRGLVENPVEWKWSSAGFWMEESEGVIPIDRESFPG